MCQIQFIKRLGKQLTKKDVIKFADLMYLGNSRNKDAHGFSNQNGVLLKNKGEVTYDDVLKLLLKKKHDFLIGHNRYKTKGTADENKNNHPLESPNFIVVHNGMISNDEKLKQHFSLDYSPEVDSYIIPALLEMYLLEPHKDLVEVVKKCAEGLQGSFSIIIQHKQTNRLFYFKSHATNFAFGLYGGGKDKVIIGSTDKDNFDVVLGEKECGIFERYPEDLLVTEPEDGYIFEIQNDGIFTKCQYKTNWELVPYKTTSYNTSSYQGVKNQTKLIPYNSNRTDDDEKLKIFKTIGKQIADILVEHAIRVATRAYDYKDNKIMFYFKENVSPEALKDIEDITVEVGVAVYKDYPKQRGVKAELILDIDYMDAKAYYFQCTRLESEDVLSPDEQLEKDYLEHLHKERDAEMDALETITEEVIDLDEEKQYPYNHFDSNLRGIAQLFGDNRDISKDYRRCS